MKKNNGNVVHLFERDCTIHRRNQKLIEIAPNSQLTPEQRQDIGGLAVKAAEAVGYENAGKVDYLLTGNEGYFMEINTRIQVEHTITEQLTGVDIVREQIRIFLFQAEGGIRDADVTGVQTCALPIFPAACAAATPSKLETPLSTVISSSAPSGAAAATSPELSP